jgi:hypothetical protein
MAVALLDERRQGTFGAERCQENNRSLGHVSEKRLPKK